MTGITTHTIVKNEENWIWYALNSVRVFVSEMLVVDDGSTDNTVEIIKSIKDPRIKLSRVNLETAREHTEMRNRVVARTETDWFMLLDGDEVWNSYTLERFIEFLGKQKESVYAVVMSTRNCVGDVYHYLPEEAGQYRLLGRRGHLTIRAYRKMPGFHWEGEYPLEKYCDPKGRPVNDQPEHLAFFEGFYWHMTHLPRSSATEKVKGWRRVKRELGIRVSDPNELPEVFNQPRPRLVPSPWRKMPVKNYFFSAAITPFKKLRRKLIYE